MKGCRPLTDEEIKGILKTFSGKYSTRNRALFLLGIKAGFRISEILSLRVGDVYSFGSIVSRVTVRRCEMKNKIEGRTVVLHSEVREALAAWINELKSTDSILDSDFLFKSRKGLNESISRHQAWKILKVAFNKNFMTGKLGTHSMRKTFADRVYDKLERDLFKTQKALFHRNINSTVSYLSFKNEEIEEAILSL